MPDLTQAQKKKLMKALATGTPVSLRITKFEGSCPLPMTKAQQAKFEKCKADGKPYNYKFGKQNLAMVKKGGNVFDWLYKNVIKPAPEAIKKGAKFAWKEFGDQGTQLLGTAVGQLANAGVTELTENPFLGTAAGTAVGKLTQKGAKALGDKLIGYGRGRMVRAGPNYMGTSRGRGCGRKCGRICGRGSNTPENYQLGQHNVYR